MSFTLKQFISSEIWGLQTASSTSRCRPGELSPCVAAAAPWIPKSTLLQRPWDSRSAASGWWPSNTELPTTGKDGPEKQCIKLHFSIRRPLKPPTSCPAIWQQHSAPVEPHGPSGCVCSSTWYFYQATWDLIILKALSLTKLAFTFSISPFASW